MNDIEPLSAAAAAVADASTTAASATALVIVLGGPLAVAFIVGAIVGRCCLGGGKSSPPPRLLQTSSKTSMMSRAREAAVACVQWACARVAQCWSKPAALPPPVSTAGFGALGPPPPPLFVTLAPKAPGASVFDRRNPAADMFYQSKHKAPVTVVPNLQIRADPAR